MLLDELLESVIMAAHALNEKDASKSLDEVEGDEEKDDFGEFNKYIDRITKNSKSLEDLLKKELGDNEGAKSILLPFETTRTLLLGTQETIANPKTDFQDPKNENAKQINSTLQNFMINLVSLRRGLESLAEWSKGLDKIGIKDAQFNKLFGVVQKESMIHKSSLSSLLLEMKSPEDYPAGSIAKAIANLANFNVNLKDVFDPDGREHKLVINYFKKLDDNIGKLEKTLGNKKALESEIDKFFKTRPGQGVIAAAWSFAKSMVASFFKPAPIGDGTILNARQAMGSIEEPSGLLFLSPKQIIDINEKVNTGLKDMKKNVSIVRDMLAFGGKDADRIQAYIKDNEIEADDYLEDLDANIDWDKEKDYKKLKAAMISSDYYGESYQVQKNLIHKNTMQNLLFEDAEEFVDLWNQFLSKGNNITQKTKEAGTLLFPKLSDDYDWSGETLNWEKKKEPDMAFPQGSLYPSSDDPEFRAILKKVEKKEPLSDEDQNKLKELVKEEPYKKADLAQAFIEDKGNDINNADLANQIADIITLGNDEVLLSAVDDDREQINKTLEEKGIPYAINAEKDDDGKPIAIRLIRVEDKPERGINLPAGKTKVSRAAMKALFPDKDEIITQALAALGNYELIESNKLLHRNSLAQLLSEEKQSLLKYIVSYYSKNAIDQTQKHWENTPGAKDAALKRLNNMLIQKKDVLKEKGIDLDEEIEIAEEEPGETTITLEPGKYPDPKSAEEELDSSPVTDDLPTAEKKKVASVMVGVSQKETTPQEANAELFGTGLGVMTPTGKPLELVEEEPPPPKPKKEEGQPVPDEKETFYYSFTPLNTFRPTKTKIATVEEIIANMKNDSIASHMVYLSAKDGWSMNTFGSFDNDWPQVLGGSSDAASEKKGVSKQKIKSLFSNTTSKFYDDLEYKYTGKDGSNSKRDMGSSLMMHIPKAIASATGLELTESRLIHKSSLSSLLREASVFDKIFDEFHSSFAKKAQDKDGGIFKKEPLKKFLRGIFEKEELKSVMKDLGVDDVFSGGTDDEEPEADVQPVSVPKTGSPKEDVEKDLNKAGIQNSKEVANDLDADGDGNITSKEAEDLAKKKEDITAKPGEDDSTNLIVEPSAEQKDSGTKISRKTDLRDFTEDEQDTIELALADILDGDIVTESSLHKLGLGILLENKANDFVELLFDSGLEAEQVQTIIKKIKDNKDLSDKLKKLGIDMEETSEKSIPGVTIRPKFMDLINKKKKQLATQAFTRDPEEGGIKGLPGVNVLKKMFGDPTQVANIEKTYNYIAKKTVKAPIFPEGKRSPKSKLIHKRSLTEALFSDDD